LDLSYCEGSGFDLKVLPKWAKRNINLQGLVLRRQPSGDEISSVLTDECISEILIACGANLRALDLTDCNCLTDETIKTITRCCTQMQYLKLNYSNTDHPNCQGEILRSMCQTLTDLQEIEIIKRGVCSIENVEYLAEGLLACKNLTSITVRHRKLVGDGFAEVIKKNTKSLRKLDLHQVGDRVAKTVSYCTNLVDLSLSGSEISEHTLEDIFRCRQLVMVSLTGCPVTDRTMEVLLCNNTPPRRSLHSLQLSGCEKLTPQTLFFLCRHKELRVLTLIRCPWVTPSSLVQVATACNKLQYLEIKDTLLKSQDIDEEDNLAGEFLKELSQLLPMARIETDWLKSEPNQSRTERKKMTTTNRL